MNALSGSFVAQSFRDGKSKMVAFERGIQISDENIDTPDEKDGTLMRFTPDNEVFGDFKFRFEYIERLLWNYAYLNRNLVILFNGERIISKNGLYDLLEQNIDDSDSILYPIIHLEEEDFEFAFSHASKKYGEEYYSFVNGQHTTQGGTHLAAFRESIVKTIREFFKKDYDASDIRTSIVAAFSIKVSEPVFESQTKTKLGSQHMEPGGQTIRNYIHDMVKRNLDNFLHKKPEIADELRRKIIQSEKERKDMAGIKKLAREGAKKASLHNKKLRDCRVHYNTNKENRLDSTLFITEGDSASGSITKSRNVNTQAVFSLKGKPKNCFGLSKKIVYQNEEFNLLQTALNIEEDLDNLRYNNIVMATDADTDGMHIRLLLLTFFLQFYPDLVKRGHIYILQTPLFRVRNKKKTFYCYSDAERADAMKEIGAQAEITRFKGLGEISPDEFKVFIGKNMRLDPVLITKDSGIDKVLSFYMGKNTPERQLYIMDNLRYELNVEEDLMATEVAEEAV